VRTAFGAVLAAAGLWALPLPAASAAECVRVVVDYGTLGGAPSSSPNTTCVSSSGTAAEVLAARASAIGAPAPRYRGNFLCAIDGYPESGCGDHGTEPYWSLWLWVDGRWTYSSLGVDSYTVRDADRDGHPDPIGFRYHEFETKRAPRANPSYPAPTTRPPTAPPRATPGATRTAAPAGTAGTGRAGATGGATAAPPGATATGPGTTPGTTGRPTASAAGSVSGTATAASTTPAASGTDGTDGPDDVSGEGEALPAFPGNESELPWGAVAGVLLAAALIGAGAYRARRAP
jgi:hypothetical protein